MKKHIVIGNWKMYVQTQEAARALVSALKRREKLFIKTDVVIAPPFVLIPTLFASGGAKKLIRLGAQTVSSFPGEMHTGEVSATMLKGFGVSAVIVGHSERREGGESDASIAEQVRRVHESSMTAVLCVGEHERDEAGTHFGIIERQLTQALKGISAGKLIIAYEPVWAIGKTSAEAMKPVDLQEMVIFIRKTLATILPRASALKVPILYGGSVEGSNARELLIDGGVGGFLVGHASSEAHTFIEILNVISQV